MDIENKANYYSYLNDLLTTGYVNIHASQGELMKKFGLDEKRAEIVVNMYIKEEIEGKRTLLSE